MERGYKYYYSMNECEDGKMKGTIEPRGVIATVSTPFLEDGKIDYESLERVYQ